MGETVPRLSAAWSHWRIEGDGVLLGVVSGERLVDALRLLDENHERYASIMVRCATVNAAGECATVDNGAFEVSKSEAPDDRLFVAGEGLSQVVPAKVP